ncbi:MAG: hypothetical protein IJ225_06155 [Solobacterium sp.]|nr:hypothetical protein [Solobacterium sp.]
MRIEEYGIQHQRTILLLPGTCCTVQVNFSAVIPLLSESFHVIGVNYDGFDSMGTTFSTMLDQTEKIEAWVKNHLNGRVDIAYGSSLGGSVVGLLVQRKNIHITHAILGSSDLDQDGPVSARLKTELLGRAFYGVLKSGKLPRWMVRMTEKKMGAEATKQYLEMIEGIGSGMKDVSRTSMCNQFYSDLVTPLDEHIHSPETTVHIFYALQMGEEYRERYLKHFEQPDIREQNYGHEELLFFKPEQWMEELRHCVD